MDRVRQFRNYVEEFGGPREAGEPIPYNVAVQVALRMFNDGHHEGVEWAKDVENDLRLVGQQSVASQNES